MRNYTQAELDRIAENANANGLVGTVKAVSTEPRMISVGGAMGGSGVDFQIRGSLTLRLDEPEAAFFGWDVTRETFNQAVADELAVLNLRQGDKVRVFSNEAAMLMRVERV